jgi:hypothetical protein
MANGKLRKSQLTNIAGGGQLRADAAEAWNAFAAYVKKHHNQNVQVTDSYRPLGSPGDLRRGKWSQWAAWERYQNGGNLAARPGTSNHGLGLALDVPYQTQKLIANYGAQFGWSKKWSDAPSEPWHFRWKEGNYPAVKKWRQDPVLSRGDRHNSVITLKKLLRKNGYWPKWVRADSRSFNRYTEKKVKEFQKAKRLTADGVVGPGTWKALRRINKK